MRLLSTALLALLASLIATAQTYTISTFAGGGLPVNLPGTSASVSPQSVAADGAGNLFFANQSTILRLDAETGIVTLVAGNGTAGFSGDNGPATSAQLFLPGGVAVDSTGGLYIADTQNYRVRKVSNGVITTVAGTGTQGIILSTGPATSAPLNGPTSVAVDSIGNLYIADPGSYRVFKVANGAITIVAGTGTPGFSGDNGPAASAQLNRPSGVGVDSANNLYIADTYNSLVRKVSDGAITTVAGVKGSPGFAGDGGPATNAGLQVPPRRRH